MKRALAPIAFALLLASCVSRYAALEARQNPRLNEPPSSAELEAAEYGIPPAGDCAQAIETTFSPTLRDPESARYQFAEPERSWLPRYHFDIDRVAPYKSGHVFGWTIRFTVNAKNGFGGYAGAQSYEAFFQEGKLRAILQRSRYPDIFGFSCWDAIAFPASSSGK
jgi:hypothetical protein